MEKIRIVHDYGIDKAVEYEGSFDSLKEAYEYIKKHYKGYVTEKYTGACGDYIEIHILHLFGRMEDKQMKRRYDEVKEIFDTMRSQMSVMSEYNDDEKALWDELATCSDEVFDRYKQDNGIAKSQNIIQISIDIDEVDLKKVESTIKDALKEKGISLYGMGWKATWTHDGYFKGEQPISWD